MIFLYGPPGSGKSEVGRRLASTLELPFIDLDAEIEARAGYSIPEIFQQEGETGFREREHQALSQALENPRAVVALGGGALLDPENRRKAEAAGTVVCLSASLPHLLSRLQDETGQRPLLAGDMRSRLPDLMAQREGHYGSFRLQIDTDDQSLEEIAWQAQVCLGYFRVRGMGSGYEVRVQPGGLDQLGELLRQYDLQGRVAVVSDENVAQLYGGRTLEALQAAGFSAELVTFPAGEQHKTMQAVASFWETFLRMGLERTSRGCQEAWRW